MEVDQSIYRAFQSGKLDGFYHAVFPSLLSYAIRLLAPDYAFLSEDCVQEAIYKAYLQRGQFARANT